MKMIIALAFVLIIIITAAVLYSMTKKDSHDKGITPPVGLNNPVTNPALVAALEDMQINPGNETNDKLMVELNKAKYLLPLLSDEMNVSEADENGKVNIEKGSLIKIITYSGTDGNIYLPLFTDWDVIKNYFDNPVDTFVLPATDAWEFTLKADKYHGIIINPGSNDLLLNKERIQYLQKDRIQN